MYSCRSLGELLPRGRGCVIIERLINCIESGSSCLGSSASQGQIEPALFAGDPTVGADDDRVAKVALQTVS
jgi:hypothetical protein